MVRVGVVRWLKCESGVSAGGAEGNTHASSPSRKRSVVVAERWMVCSSLAGGDVKALALSDVGETRGLVP